MCVRQKERRYWKSSCAFLFLIANSSESKTIIHLIRASTLITCNNAVQSRTLIDYLPLPTHVARARPYGFARGILYWGVRTTRPTHNSANWARKKGKSWERGYRPHYFLAYWAALKSSKAIHGLSPTTQPSWPEGISYASPGPISASVPSSRTVFNLPEITKPT